MIPVLVLLKIYKLKLWELIYVTHSLCVSMHIILDTTGSPVYRGNSHMTRNGTLYQP